MDIKRLRVGSINLQTHLFFESFGIFVAAADVADRGWLFGALLKILGFFRLQSLDRMPLHSPIDLSKAI